MLESSESSSRSIKSGRLDESESSSGDSDKFPDALQLSSSTNTAVLGLDRIGRSASIEGNSRFVLKNLGAVAQLNITPLIEKRNPVGKYADMSTNQGI